MASGNDVGKSEPSTSCRRANLPPAAPVSHDRLDARWAGQAVDDRDVVVDNHVDVCNAVVFHDILIDVR